MKICAVIKRYGRGVELLLRILKDPGSDLGPKACNADMLLLSPSRRIPEY
jgi:hypothetical protein